MGATGSLHQPEWTAEDARAARRIPAELRQKLRGLDYRVRKNLARYNVDASDRFCASDAYNSAEEGDEDQHMVIYHTEGVPESLDRLHARAARFTIDIDDIWRAQRKQEWGEVVSSTCSLAIEPPAVNLPSSVHSIPRMVLHVSFTITAVAPIRRLHRKASLSTHGVYTIGIELNMRVSPESEEHRDGTERRILRSDESCPSDSDNDSVQSHSTDLGGNLGMWEVVTVVGFATSQAFAGADAETQDCFPDRWWNEKEQRRQSARPSMLNPTGPFSLHVGAGGTVLDLRFCEPRKLIIDSYAPWKTLAASHRSAQEIWALLARPSREVSVATPFRRRLIPRSSSTALGRVSSCADIVRLLAAFALESAKYDFEADIWFGLGLSNFH